MSTVGRIFIGISWRFSKLVKKQNLWPFLLFSHHNVVIEEFYKKICSKIEDLSKSSYLMHIHIMDLHDCRAINRLYYLLIRLKYFPKWFFARLKKNTNRHFAYDSSLMNIDKYLGKILISINLKSGCAFRKALHRSQFFNP